MTATSDPISAPPRRLTILTINYHCSALVLELVSSLEACADPSLAILVVDNSPGDPGLDPLRDRPGLTLLQAERNLGFGAGCNLGLEHLQRHDPDSLVWLLNPDARLLPGAIAAVRRCLQAPGAPAVLGTRIRDLQGRIWFDRGRFDPWLGRLLHRPASDSSAAASSAPPAGAAGTAPPATAPAAQGAARRDDQEALSEASDWLSGCSLILDPKALSVPPRFDPQFFLDYEDAELCLRLRRHGHPARVTRAVLVEHAVSAVTARAPRAKYRHATFSKLYLLHRHATPLGLGLNLLLYALRPLGQWPRDRSQALGRWAGLADYLAWCGRRWRGDRRLRHPRTRFTAAS
ncbi:MAG: glycosyltransferase family 2 protein [Synechococcaceae cyanobacterium]|nr:glycosyltransferase family 2 protein [Synechococcaceae cyanobacterium]